MTAKSYAHQLNQILTVGSAPSESETLRMLVGKIHQDPGHAFVLKNAAALLHAQIAVRQVRQNIRVMRRELKGQLEEFGFKEWRFGIR